MKHALSGKERLILELLEARERYGLELVDASGGALKRGTVYVTLARMEAQGLVTSRHEEAPPKAGGMPRRLYRRTALAAQLLALQQSMSDAIAASHDTKLVKVEA